MYEFYTNLPQGYEEDKARLWPVLITLHGAGERHVSLEDLSGHHYYLPVYDLCSERFPTIVIVPHCPPREYWEEDEVDALREHVLREMRGDPARVYLDGFSMGGYGTWLTAGKYPSRYAAIAPVCGGGNPQDAHRLAHVPTWAFHGAKDPVVPVDETLRMIKAIEAAGGHPKLTIYPEGDHGVWDETFANPELYAWFSQQQLPHAKAA